MKVRKKKYQCRLIGVVAALAWVTGAVALEPHEIALLVNAGSPDSLLLANEYAAMRGIPDAHVVLLDLPDGALKPPYTITGAQFQQRIREPVLAALEERGIADLVYAWVYSTDFPIRVHIPDLPLLSLQGMTLLGTHQPSEPEVTRGMYRSPYYAGPTPGTEEGLRNSRTFDRMIKDPSAAEAVPSMMLSFTRSRGLSMEEAVSVLRRGVAADGAIPSGVVYFVDTGDENRSGPRRWQFAPVSGWLKANQVRSEVTDTFPERAADITGLLTGATTVDPQQYGVFAPGSIAGHMTSLAAAFDNPQQTKLTAWLRAGATASSGTVVEPYSLWMKFPTAFLFLHYRSGCSVMESYFQSVRCPLQLLIVGEPLSRPWVRKPAVSLIALEDGPLRGRASFYARMFPQLPPGTALRYRYRLNDRPLPGAGSDELILDTTKLADGYHTLRVMIDTGREVNVQTSAALEFAVDNKGRLVEMTGVQGNEEVAMNRPLTVQLRAAGGAAEVGVRSRARELAVVAGHEGEVRVALAMTGAGPVPLQPFARFEGGETVYGKTIRVRVQSCETGEEGKSNDEKGAADDD